MMVMMMFTVATLLLGFIPSTLSSTALIINLGYNVPQPEPTIIFAVQVCVGLYNRNGPMVYTLQSQDDVDWFEQSNCSTCNHTITNTTGSEDVMVFLQNCLSEENGPGGGKHLRYNYTSQKLIVPNIATLAAVLDAVPLDDVLAHALNINSAPVFDCLKTFAPIKANDTSTAPREVTAYVFDHYGNQTTTMSKMNPGLATKTPKHILNPPLTGSPKLGLVDFIVKEKLFNFFLNLGCIAGSEDNKLTQRIVTTNNWPRPISVFGYDDTFGIAGNLFEAETDCTRQHNMGQIASAGCSNLAFFSAEPRIDTPLLQPADPPSIHEPYDASKTYISFIMGDGDNINAVKHGRKSWMNERLQSCQTNASACFPLVWSMSPAILYVAPAMLRWYYAKAQVTMQDWFVLPPSGHTYSYPSQMTPSDQVSFVHLTEQDATLMNASGTVSWEFFDSWGHAIKEFFPQYAANGVIKACFAVNVPFLFPVLAFGTEHYKILTNDQGEEMVLFAPHEWRGSGAMPSWDGPTPQEFAKEINNYAPGTVTHVYTTSDGGFTYSQLVQLEALLDSHVHVVGANEIVQRAHQRSAHLSNNSSYGNTE